MFILLILLSLPLEAMHEFSIQKKSISNLLEAEYIGNDDIVLHTKMYKKHAHVEDILLYEMPANKITKITCAENLNILAVDPAHGICMFDRTCNDNNQMQEQIVLYDYIEQKEKYTQLPLASPWQACLGSNKTGIVMYNTRHAKAAFTYDQALQADNELSVFLQECCGSVYYYQPQDDKILSYCSTKGAFYYGSVKRFRENLSSDVYFTEKKTQMHYLNKHAVRIPLLVFFCKNRASNILSKDVRKHHCNQVCILNVIERSCTSIDHPELIVALDIHPNKKYFVTLSCRGEISYINIAQKKCVYGPLKANGNNQLFSEEQLTLSVCRLLSFSPDGKSLMVVMGNNLFITKVPWDVVYGIDYHRAISIVFSLKHVNMFIPKDIQHLLILTITQLLHNS